MTNIQKIHHECAALKTRLELITDRELQVTVLIDGVPVDMLKDAPITSSPIGRWHSKEINECLDPLHIHLMSEKIKS